MSFEVLYSFFIFSLIAWYITAPLFSTEKVVAVKNIKTDILNDLDFKKNEILLSLKDLELDYKMDKISEEDYNDIYKETFEQGTSILQEIEDLKIGKTKNQEPIKTPISQNQQTTKFCIHCGQNLPEIARFCPQCGKQIKA